MGSAIATAYGPPWGDIQGTGTTATGIDLHGGPHKLIVAVDPSVIPLGSRLKIWPNPFGNKDLVFTAADTGGAIKGNHIDFYDWRGRQDQAGWGMKNVSYSIVGKGAPTDAATLGAGADASAGSPSDTSPAASSGGWADALRRPLLKGFLELAFVGGGAVLVGVGLYRTANATPAGRGAIKATRRVAKTTELAAA